MLGTHTWKRYKLKAVDRYPAHTHTLQTASMEDDVNFSSDEDGPLIKRRKTRNECWTRHAENVTATQLRIMLEHSAHFGPMSIHNRAKLNKDGRQYFRYIFIRMYYMDCFMCEQLKQFKQQIPNNPPMHEKVHVSCTLWL